LSVITFVFSAHTFLAAEGFKKSPKTALNVEFWEAATRAFSLGTNRAGHQTFDTCILTGKVKRTQQVFCGITWTEIGPRNPQA
jgi:hypothetical protein